MLMKDCKTALAQLKSQPTRNGAMLSAFLNLNQPLPSTHDFCVQLSFKRIASACFVKVCLCYQFHVCVLLKEP